MIPPNDYGRLPLWVRELRRSFCTKYRVHVQPKLFHLHYQWPWIVEGLQSAIEFVEDVLGVSNDSRTFGDGYCRWCGRPLADFFGACEECDYG
jgi:hypothetical protein